MRKTPPMKSDSTEQIRLLKEETVRIFGKSLDSPTDYDALAAEILEKTGKSISSTTLKRVFGYIKNGNAPTGATLGLLARYCGYAGWADWCSRHGAGTGTNGETGRSRARKVSITSISAAALLIAALMVWRPWAENPTAEQPAAISEPPAFEETDGETLRYHELLKYCTDAAAVKCDSVRSRREGMTMDEYYRFAMQEYSRILDDMRDMAEQCATDAFKDNDTLQRMYSAQIFNACREICMPVWTEAQTEYQDSLQAMIDSMP